MGAVDGDPIYELLKRIQMDVSSLKEGQRKIKAEISAVRGTMISMAQDVHNIYGVLARHELRLDRIESRLELRELAESQQVHFDPSS